MTESTLTTSPSVTFIPGSYIEGMTPTSLMLKTFQSDYRWVSLSRLTDPMWTFIHSDGRTVRVWWTGETYENALAWLLYHITDPGTEDYSERLANLEATAIERGEVN